MKKGLKRDLAMFCSGVFVGLLSFMFLDQYMRHFDDDNIHTHVPTVAEMQADGDTLISFGEKANAVEQWDAVLRHKEQEATIEGPAVEMIKGKDLELQRMKYCYAFKRGWYLEGRHEDGDGGSYIMIDWDRPDKAQFKGVIGKGCDLPKLGRY